jgi:alkylhydroperoxidase family enzyme
MSAPAQPQESVAALLAEVKKASGGRLLALHTDLARSPAALAAYLGLRRAGGEYGSLDPSVVAAVMLATGTVDGGAYSQAIATQLAIRAGMSPQETITVRAGDVDDARTAALLAVIREAAANAGVVSQGAWVTATAAGWSDEQLIEAFVYLALTVFVDYFVNYAGTILDVPPAPPITAGAEK